jgi:hypothetical protein
MQNQIFSEKAMNKLKTADDLEQYVQITNPRVWIIMAACAALLTGLLVWAFFGTAATTVEARAAMLEEKMQCFLPSEEYQLVRVGDPAYINHMPWTVSECSGVPLSRDAAYGIVGSDFLYYELIKANKSYQVTLEPVQSGYVSGTGCGSGPATVDVVIHTRSVHPIDLILKRQAS